MPDALISLGLAVNRRYHWIAVNRKELQELSKVRWKEAHALLGLGLSDGAFYLAGYAVECALKACIAKGTRRGEFPDKKKVESSHSHNLLQLSRVAGLDEAFSAQAVTDAEFRYNWDYVQSWSEQSRYRRYTSDYARALLDATGDKKHGVVWWISKRW